MDKGAYNGGIVLDTREWLPLGTRELLGLRQGYLLSPFLLIIVTQALSRLTKKLEESGLLAGFSVSQGLPPTYHFHFADDTIFFFT